MNIHTAIALLCLATAFAPMIAKATLELSQTAVVTRGD